VPERNSRRALRNGPQDQEIRDSCGRLESKNVLVPFLAAMVHFAEDFLPQPGKLCFNQSLENNLSLRVVSAIAFNLDCLWSTI
jgi:hypothetical protein